MKKLSILLATLLSFSAHSLAADYLSMGRDGAAFEENGIQWQPVKFETPRQGCKAAMPGTFGGNMFMVPEIIFKSELNGVVYTVVATAGQFFQPPAKESEFLNQARKEMGKQGQVVAIASNQENVKYIVEGRFKKVKKVTRLYCSSNSIYRASVEGPDLSLAPLFFENVQILK